MNGGAGVRNAALKAEKSEITSSGSVSLAIMIIQNSAARRAKVYLGVQPAFVCLKCSEVSQPPYCPKRKTAILR